MMKMGKVLIKHVKILDSTKYLFEITTGIDNVTGTVLQGRSHIVTTNQITYIGTISEWISKDGRQVATHEVEGLLNLEAKRRILLLKYNQWLPAEATQHTFEEVASTVESLKMQVSPTSVPSIEEQREKRREELRRLRGETSTQQVETLSPEELRARKKKELEKKRE